MSNDNFWIEYGDYPSFNNSISCRDYVLDLDKGVEYEDSKEVEVSIIPKLKETNEISLSKGDTLVVYLPEEAMDSDVDELQEISDMFDKMFPNNQVLFLPNTFKLGVIKNV